MFSATFPDVFLAEKRNDYLDDDIPDEEDTNATPASPIPSQPSRSPSFSPSPLANKSHAPPQHSMPAWDMCKTMCIAGGTGLEQVIAAAVDAMPQEGLPLASVRAGGEGRRAGLKRRAAEITRSAAEDFALLTTRTSSMRRYAADFLSTVANVSFRDVYLNLSKLI
jgi:hypothetical protein